MFQNLKRNCARFQEVRDTEDGNLEYCDSYFVVKQTTPSNYEHEKACYEDLKSEVTAAHDFFFLCSIRTFIILVGNGLLSIL